MDWLTLAHEMKSLPRLMTPSIVYDLSRLVTRVLNATPNGIDRIDLLLARHFLIHGDFRALAIGLGFTGPRVLSHKAARAATERAAAAWREDLTAHEGSPAYEAVVARLNDQPAAPAGARRIVAPRPRRPLHVAQTILRHLPPGARSPRRAAPRGALYLNATHFPLEWKRHVAWLDDRSDIRPVFWIHDLLAIEHPEWFWGREPALHGQRLDLLARRGAGAIVGSLGVEQSLRQFMARHGRTSLPIVRMAPPVAPVFAAPRHEDPRLAEAAFFIICGTIEPRKNHLLLLRVWRQLVAQFGREAPKLVVIGKRGWNNEEIVSSLEDESLRGHVIEVAGLPTPDYKRLLDHCRAVLAPSFAEGFGLPVAEALAAGAPVLASDIPPFREQAGNEMSYLDPRSESDWGRAILAMSQVSARPNPRQSAIASHGSMWGAAFFSRLDAFLRDLVP
jgi:glycosyltransferase involved in cell wall biosynthesis